MSKGTVSDVAAHMDLCLPCFSWKRIAFYNTDFTFDKNSRHQWKCFDILKLIDLLSNVKQPNHGIFTKSPHDNYNNYDFNPSICCKMHFLKLIN